jgi:hypothetical protein
VLESTLPIRCHEFALSADSAGAGRYRGGFGTRRTYEILAETCEVSALGDRFIAPPFGLEGGQPGATAQLQIKRAGTDATSSFDEAFDLQSPSKFSSVTLRRGDRISMITGGGGGFGRPIERPTDDVIHDLNEELISAEAAVNEYGVRVRRQGSWVIDHDATRTLRAQRSSEAPPMTSGASEPIAYEAPSGSEADDVARVSELLARVRAEIGHHPCVTVCPKHGDPVRCPFHHPFASEFWDAATLERWATRNCVIAGRTGLGSSPTEPRSET